MNQLHLSESNGEGDQRNGTKMEQNPTAVPAKDHFACQKR